ncbi:Hsp70 family protein [Plantactinospora sp. S1510]|uniref:Hsp70 family protein n=1 Tax=Plantactinospora alkalitolerans TaxID=2789879 RepID=A0ABS0H037_9ACTN|nr:Hsp70 family protein [Plantactinospora alkalitolerans]MBF9131790.1 Hsp70 family protein [Plantactinospora alkalitolerans]
MASAPRLAIDFGTSHTVAVCRWREGEGRPLLFDASPLLPSAVLADAAGRLLVGRDAVRAGRTDPGSLEPYPKRRIDEGSILLGRTEVTVVEVVAAVLRRCADEAVRVAGRPIGDLVLTHPAAWGPRRREILVDAAGHAGLPRPALLAEPVAAATYFTTVLARSVRTGAAVIVYDFGAGTFDVAVLRRRPDGGWDVADSQGLADLGGLDLDGIVVERVRAAALASDVQGWRRLTQPGTEADLRNRQSLWEEARAAKEQLSRRSTAGMHLPIFERDVHVTREEFESAANATIERTVALTAATMSASGLDRGQVAGLFLVGGASRVPLVATSLHRRLGLAPTIIEQPELVVAQGALLATVIGTGRGSAVATPPDDVPVPAHPVPVPAHPARVDRAPASGQPVTPVDPPATPAVTWRRRRGTWIGAAVVLVLVAAVVVTVVIRANRQPPLSTQGLANEQVIHSPALRAFARPWLDHVTDCEQRAPDTYGGRATEYVACAGDGWEVQFRALDGQAGRDLSRDQRVEAYDGIRKEFTGERPRSGTQVRYVFGPDQRVIYWDDDDSAMVGDLTTVGDSTLDFAALLRVWQEYVG